MNSILKVFVFTLLGLFSVGVVKGQTREFKGDTQIEINYNANQEYILWEKRMKTALTKAVESNKNDSLFLVNLIKSQKIWETWRDAEIETFYPNYKNSSEFYGSMQPVCYFSKLIDWTEIRIVQLEIYSNSVENGDACPPGKN